MRFKDAPILGGFIGGAAFGALIERLWHPDPLVWVAVCIVGTVLLGAELAAR
jgi:uncharacterized membrane protein YoaK (UPF0700 family)